MQQIKLFDKNKPTCLGGCLISTGVLLFMGIIGVLGQSFYDEISPLSIFLCTVVVIAAIFYIIRHYDSGQYQQEVDNLQKKKKEIKKIADKYNALTADLKTQYQARVKSKDPNETKASIRNSFSKQYTQNKNEFEKERSAFVIEWDKAHPSSTRLKKMWQWGICIGFIVFLGACSFTFGVTMKPEPPQSPMAQLMESRSWNANNIPMPHMKDHSLYVSNPDSILLKETVDSINVILGQLDDVLGIESAMVIVGHIDNDDPVAMVRGIYEKYKVGRNNRGLVIVVGYLDHSYFIAPGRSLEADLTDLECNHLAQDYLIPSMKANDPNSGMLYLAHGVYALMSGKELPQMTTLSSSNQDDDEGPNFLFPIIYLLLIICWGVYASRQSEKLGWTNTMGSFLAANPFVVQRTSGGSSYSGHSSRSSHSSSGSSWSSGSSHSSGGYGGGSWGGGGSGGRW